MKFRLAALVVIFLITLPSAFAQELSGDYLYKVSTIRAATGELSGLLDWLAELKESDYFDIANEHPPFVMRHSQGDQWDLLIITPMGSWMSYYSEAAAAARDEAMASHTELLAPGYDMIAFDEDQFAYGPSLAAVKAAYEANSFYHIEMFEAAPGKADELFGQRRMENDYLSATGQTPNIIFRRVAGSDVDVFTIGFHKSLEAFAAPASATDEEKEAAAKAAGFKDRSDISFYLRSLLSGHHDTLAVKVE
jgi:hypothetical protein